MSVGSLVVCFESASCIFRFISSILAFSSSSWLLLYLKTVCPFAALSPSDTTGVSPFL